jgi:hypothetical protein
MHEISADGFPTSKEFVIPATAAAVRRAFRRLQ